MTDCSQNETNTYTNHTSLSVKWWYRNLFFMQDSQSIKTIEWDRVGYLLNALCNCHSQIYTLKFNYF